MKNDVFAALSQKSEKRSETSVKGLSEMFGLSGDIKVTTLLISSLREKANHPFKVVADPVENIEYLVPAKRIRCFRTDDSSVLGGVKLDVGVQYSLSIKSDVGIIVQYGRLDVQQSNMAYMALMAQSDE